ncbi:MAG: hypothetical protein HY074_01020 [Deltaproteobacteria bacterium]|nr:hypothetical protein [Deltaproteobacteria bacterium]
MATVMRLSLISAAALFAVMASSCTTASWRDHESSTVLENQREILARFRIRQHGVALNDCVVCLSIDKRFDDSCAKLDSSGLVYKTVTRSYAWLKTLSCRLESGAKVSRKFTFPYFAAPTDSVNTVHYLGEVQIDLEGDTETTVLVADMLGNTLNDLRNRGKPPLALKIHTSLLTKQDNTWGDAQNTPER